jgi:glycosyltransferase involved in cell wall biosynthesis
MRVLHVLSGIDPRVGGPVAALIGLSRAQALAGLKVDVLATYIKGNETDAAQRMRDVGIHVELIGPCTSAMSWHPAIKGIADRLARQADVVHIHALFEEVQHQAARAARRWKKPYLFRPCGMLDPWSLSQKSLKKRLYMAWRLRRDLNGANAIHYTTQMEAEMASPLGLAPPTIVEPNGVDVAEFETLPPRGSFRSTQPALRDRPMILFLSRIHKKKGLDLLIPAFARAPVGDAVLVLAGPDDEGYGMEVRRLIDANGLQDRVIFTGMLHGRDRVAALADADLFVLSSYTENFGIAVIEALAAGAPVVISDGVNICREVAAAGVGAVVPLNVEALSVALTQWMGDASLRARAAALSRTFVWDRYDWGKIALRWAGHYERLLASADPSCATSRPAGAV